MKNRGFFKTIICLMASLSVFVGTVDGQASQRIHSQQRRGNDSIDSVASGEFNRMKHKNKVSANPAYNERVRRVGYRIVEAARQDSAELPPPNQWEFVVFDDGSLNAFALPEGKVGVNTGLLELTANDDELAAVMGHEVAHVAKRHGQQRISQNVLVTGIGLGIALATLNVKSATRNGVLAAYGLGASVGFLLPYSRKHETEADYLGLHYMASAGYNPKYAITFWEKMETQQRMRPIEFLSTHPSDQRRIKRLQGWLPDAMNQYHQHLKNPVPPVYKSDLTGRESTPKNSNISTKNENNIRYIPIENRSTRSPTNAH